MKVLIAYNIPPHPNSQDFLCHVGVLDELRDVREALEELGHTVSVVGIGENIAEEISRILSSDADLVFNLCESIRERSGLQPCFAGLLELLNVPFTGSPQAAITVAIDKRLTKACLAQEGIPTPEAFWVKEAGELNRKTLASFPYIVKPAKEDGSIGLHATSVVEDEGELAREVERVCKRYRDGALVERYIEGREFNIGFLGGNEPVALAVVEICFENMPPGHRNFLSYSAKWLEGSPEARGWSRRCPADIPNELRDEIILLGQAAYNAVGLLGYGRVDLRLDKGGHLHVLEVNANPDLTRSASFAQGARAAGIAYVELVDRILKSAL